MTSDVAASLCFKVKETGWLRQKHVKVKEIRSLFVKEFQFPYLMKIFVSDMKCSLHSVQLVL